MQNKIGLEQKLEQRLNLTQEMKMSIEILKLNGAELLEYVMDESQNNPAVDSDHVVSQVEKLNENYNLPDLVKYLDTPGTSYTTYEPSDNEMPEFNISDEESLSDYLIEQLGYIKLSRNEKIAGEYIIYSLDEWGYFRQSIEEAARNLRLHKGIVEKAFAHVRSLEPTGVGARNLNDCLLMQLTKNGNPDPVLMDLVRDDLESIGMKQTQKLLDKYGITQEKLNEYIKTIKSLNPKPASGFRTGGEATVYIVPDADISFDEDGKMIVVLNNEIIPEIRISPKYLKLLEDAKESDKEALQKYITRAINIAKFIEKRNTTLKNVITSIATYEEEYIKEVADHIQPLTLSQISEDNNLSISTISRTVRGKYISTPRGVLSLRDFFQRSFKQGTGEVISKEYIQDRISNIIAEEVKTNPLSDNTITEILNSSGIEIKRRTIAKYREEMGIPNAFQRRQGS